jgi:WD40 repeat protein
MHRVFFILLLLSSQSAVAEEISFKKQIAPILVRRCLGCHDNRKTEGRYALHTFEQLLKKGDSGEAPIVAGKPAQSFLLQKLMDEDEFTRMPQEDDPLSKAEIALIKQWISQGAKFDGPSKTDRLVTLLPPRQHPQPPENYRTSVPVFAVRFSPDGKLLYTGGVHELLVWDVATGKLRDRIPGLPQRIHAIRFSSDGKTIVVGGGAPGDYGEIRLIDLPGKQVRIIATWEDVVLDLAITDDGKRVVAGGADHSVRAYDLATGRESWRTQQHVDWVTALDITDYRFAEEHVPNKDVPDFLTFNEYERISGSHVRQHWQFPGKHYIVREANWELEVGETETVSLTKITITGIGKTYKVKREAIDAKSLPEHAAAVEYLKSLHKTWGTNMAGTPFVVSSSSDRTVKVFALDSGNLFTTYKGHRREYGPLKGLHRVFGIQAEPGTRRVWSGGEGHHFHGWNPVTVRDEDGTAADMEARFAKEYSVDHIRHDFGDTVYALVRSGSELFAAAADGQVKNYAIASPAAKFDLNRASTLNTYSGQSDFLFALDVSQASRRIATSGFTGEVVLWDLEKTQPVVRFIASPGVERPRLQSAVDGR